MGSRNWTSEETNLFCEILVNPSNNFMETLEKKALKKASTTEVFECIAQEFKSGLEDPGFIVKNEKNFKGKKLLPVINLDIKRLQSKYNNLKQKWRKLKDLKKSGSGLAGEEDPEWYKIISPILADSNKGLEELCSDPSETSFYNEYFQGEASGRNNDENSPEEDHLQREISTESDKDETAEAENHSLPKKKVVVRPHEKRTVARSQLQAISQLATGVNKLAEVNSKRLKMEESFLQFRRDEAEKNRQHEREMAEMYLRMANKTPTLGVETQSISYRPHETISPTTSWPSEYRNLRMQVPPTTQQYINPTSMVRSPHYISSTQNFNIPTNPSNINVSELMSPARKNTKSPHF